ncbi:MAG: hypothetical protein Q7U38_00470 [Methylobacter sp.]|nr:hypothetical protein [Methylobacter sp.]
MTDPDKSVSCVGSGWSRIVWEALEQAGQLGEPVSFQQIKQKWGELRIYGRTARGHYNPPGDVERRLDESLEAARAASLVTCEVCTAPAVAEKTRVRCTACADKNPVQLVCLSAAGVISHQ